MNVFSDGLPIVLGGPMIRRVDPKIFTVWLALSKQSRVCLKVYRAGSDVVLCQSRDEQAASLRLGANLWVYLVRASGSYPHDTFLEYDVEVDGKNLVDLGLDRLALPGFSRPSFFVPRSSRSVLAGSCRKVHGGAASDGKVSSDGLVTSWRLIKEHSINLASRPSALLLLGDQIYADDVAGPLLEALKRTAITLMGADEELPNIGFAGALRFGTRWEPAFRVGLTSGNAHHHLLSLGEFCAMYLAVCGGYYQDPPAWADVQHPSDRPNDKDKTLYDEELKQVQSFLEGTPEVRALLANVPSYAIFDDHEVTDDWYLDGASRDNTLGDEGARRIVSNALCAYWAFQAWGNDPDVFDHSFRRFVEEGCRPSDRNTNAGKALDQCVLSFDSWHFVTPTNPAFFFLDTRTQRRYIGPKRLGQLAGPRMLQWLRGKIRSIQALNSKPVFIVTATPVHGFMPIELVQGIASRTFGSFIDSVDLDFESWIAQREGYYELMRSLLDAGVTRCTFLSGDVHYGFVKEGRFYHRGDECEILQIVSSALHNQPAGAKHLGFLEIFGKKLERRVGFLGNRLQDKLRRHFRPYWHDFITYWGMYRPDTSNGQAWFDESRVIPLHNNKFLVFTEHIALLVLDDGEPVRVEFHFAEGTAAIAHTRSSQTVAMSTTARNSS